MVFSISLYAQNQIKFNSINSGGITIGQSGSYGLFQTINGAMFQKWFAGLGAGYDYYYYTTIPLFIDARRYLNKQNNGFLYADIGYNFPWKNKPGKQIFNFSSYHFTGGLYSDIGIGYITKFIKKASFVMSAGYSYKKLNNKVGVINPCLVPPCPETFSDYDYGYGRIILKAGIQLK
jgi:hypothetical protein